MIKYLPLVRFLYGFEGFLNKSLCTFVLLVLGCIGCVNVSHSVWMEIGVHFLELLRLDVLTFLTRLLVISLLRGVLTVDMLPTGVEALGVRAGSRWSIDLN